MVSLLKPLHLATGGEGLRVKCRPLARRKQYYTGCSIFAIQLVFVKKPSLTAFAEFYINGRGIEEDVYLVLGYFWPRYKVTQVCMVNL